jgi:hypothetical protein
VTVTLKTTALILAGAAVLSLGAACSTAPPPASAHNLERPSDMAFACVGLFGVLSADGGTSTTDTSVTTPTVSGRPMSWCHAPGKFDLPFDVEHRTFAFVSNTARHELSLLDMDNSKLIDLDPSNPETNVAPLGVLPEQISASDDGCRIVSANRGSCDLSMVDVGKLVTPTLNAEGNQSTAESARSTVSQDIVVQGPAGKRLYVAPQEVVFLPQDTSALDHTQNLCTVRPYADPVGWNATPTIPSQTQWKALVSYPTCDLVALVDLPSGIIVDSVKITPHPGGGIDVVNTGSDPDCPQHDFCDATTAPAGGATGADGGSAASDGAAPAPVAGDLFVNPTGTRPGPMAILPSGRRAYIGLTQASFVAAIDIAANKLVVPASPSITLHEGALGAQRVRLSVDPYKQTGNQGQFGRFVGEGTDRSRQYLYVVANDGTVRVVDVSLGTQNLPEVECDTSLDPVYLRAHLNDSTDDGASIATCPPAAPPDFAHRLPFTQGPGIRLPAIPRDVSFVDFKLGNALESVLDGAYAFILTSSGVVYIVNIDGTPRTTTLISGTTTGTIPLDAPLPEVPPLVNSLRDHNALTFLATMDPSLGPPRVDLVPAAPAEGPQIQPVTTYVALDNATDVNATATNPIAILTYVFFPERTAVNRQTWTVSWQGDFYGPSFSGQFTYYDNPQRATTIKDVGTDFCQAGAVPGDVVTIYGCTNDLQCGPLQVCKRSDTSPETVGTLPINGLCLPADPTLQAERLKTCAPLLDTVRRYEIVGATRSALTVRPKLDEVVSTVFTGCVPGGTAGGHAGVDAGVNAGDAGAAADGGTLTSCAPATDPTRARFICAEVDPGAGQRCVQPCTQSVECRPGRVCVAYGSASYCADAPDPSQMLAAGSQKTLLSFCGLDQLTAYKIGVGSGFLVQGTAPTPYVPPLVDANSACQVNPQRLNRIPYVQTAADGTRTLIPTCIDIAPVDAVMPVAGADGGTVQDPLFNIAHTAPNPSPCLIGTLTDGQLGPPYRVLFQNREIRFILADAEEYFSDSVFIAFDVHGGFLADTVFTPGTIDVEMPTRIVTSPIDSQGQLFDGSETTEIPYLYVVDQRRLGRAGAGVAATRGQVLRIHPRRSFTTDVNVLLPIYEDYSLSVNLWPIQ